MKRSKPFKNEEANYIWSLLPPAISEKVLEGLDASCYLTGTAEGDKEVQERVKTILKDNIEAQYKPDIDTHVGAIGKALDDLVVYDDEKQERDFKRHIGFKYKLYLPVKQK